MMGDQAIKFDRWLAAGCPDRRLRDVRLYDDRRYQRAYGLDKATGKIVARTDRFEGQFAGWVRRSCGRVFAIYKSIEAGIGEVIVLQLGRRRLVLDQDASHYQTTVSVYAGVARRVTIRREGRTVFTVAGLYPWLALGPIIDATWDGLDEIAEDFPQTITEIVGEPEHRRRALELWSAV